MATLTQDVKQLVQEKAKAIRVGIEIGRAHV